MRYRVTRPAEKDLDEIFLYWARRASTAAADRVIDGIIERFWLLGERPDAGRQPDELAPGLKCFPAGKYLIYYRVTRHGGDILHIFHGARDQVQALQVAALSKKPTPPT